MIKKATNIQYEYTIEGNTIQDGVPSSQNPIMPQGTGDRTGNLLDYTTVESTTNATATQISGGISVSGRYYVRFRTVEFTVGSTYTMSWKANTIGGTSAPAWRFHYADNTYSSMPSSGGSLVVEKEVSELLLYVSTTESCVVDFTEIMLNTGSTPLPYEKFGYKIPILSANTTTPVYLGEVQTTRKIKKIKASDITWIDGSATGYNFYRGTLTIPKLAGGGISTLLSNKYRSANTRNNLLDGDIASYNLTTIETIVIRDDRYSSAADWLSANGDTEIYYVLATETTGIVNEPLMKIGNYVDTINNNQSGIPISTNNLTVNTTIPPSKIDITSTATWIPIPYNKYNTETISTIAPIDFLSNGQDITIGLKGNAEQLEIPSPNNPIMPQGTGERTSNLFDESNFALVQVTTSAYRYGTNLGMLPSGEYTFNATKLSGAQSIYLTAKLNNTFSQTTISTVPFTFTADGNSEYIIRTARNTGTTWEAEKYSDTMLNSGSTPLPYEPYGYFIEIEVS